MAKAIAFTPAQLAGSNAASSIDGAVKLILASECTARDDAALKLLARGFHEGYMSRRLNLPIADVIGKFAPLDLQPGKKAPYTQTDEEAAVYNCSKERWSEACTLAGLPKLVIGGGGARGPRAKGGGKGDGDTKGAVENLAVPTLQDSAAVLNLLSKVRDFLDDVVRENAKRITGDAGSKIRTTVAEFGESIGDCAKALAADRAPVVKPTPVVDANAELAATRAMLADMAAQLAAATAKPAKRKPAAKPVLADAVAATA